jgi:hypothetical protein
VNTPPDVWVRRLDEQRGINSIKEESITIWTDPRKRAANIQTSIAVIIDVSQDTFPDSQNKKTLYYGGLGARGARLPTYLFAADSGSISRFWIWRKRRFQHKQEILCEKNHAVTQATCKFGKWVVWHNLGYSARLLPIHR